MKLSEPMIKALRALNQGREGNTNTMVALIRRGLASPGSPVTITDAGRAALQEIDLPGRAEAEAPAYAEHAERNRRAMDFLARHCARRSGREVTTETPEYAGAHAFRPNGQNWRGEVEQDRCAYPDCGAGKVSPVHTSTREQAIPPRLSDPVPGQGAEGVPVEWVTQALAILDTPGVTVTRRLYDAPKVEGFPFAVDTDSLRAALLAGERWGVIRKSFLPTERMWRYTAAPVHHTLTPPCSVSPAVTRVRYTSDLAAVTCRYCKS